MVITLTEEEEIVFFCEECKKESKTPGVLCCGKPVKQKPLESCDKAPADAEHARFGDKDDACDDGR